MGNVNIKKENIERRIIKYLKENTDVAEWHDDIIYELRQKIKEILDDEFDNLVLY